MVGTLTVEEIIHERAALAKSVQDVAVESLNNQGLIIDTLQISSVEDATGYLANLGRPDSARVEKNACKADGLAEAEAIAAAGRAEAAAIDAKAKAYAQFNQAAIIDRLAEVLPKIAHELAQPYGNIDDLTVISTDGADTLSQASPTTSTRR